MTLIEELKGLGADVDEALDRVMGDNDLYEMLLGTFLSSLGENNVSVSDFDGSDLDGLIKRVHTLKGVTGNLGLTPLFKSYTDILGKLRDNQPKAAKAGYEQLIPVQEAFTKCIQRHMGM